MTIERWDRLKELMHQALQLGPEERARFLDETCASDQALRAGLESLLPAGEDVRSSFLEALPLAGGLDTDGNRTDSIGALQSGQVFGQRFQLVRKQNQPQMNAKERKQDI